MRPAISQVCSLPSPFDRDIEDYAAGQCRHVDVWFTKLEEYLKTKSVEQVRQLLQQHDVTAEVGSFQGGLLVSQGAARLEAWQLFRQRLELSEQIGIQTLIVVGDIVGPLQQQDLERAQTSLLQIAQEAGRRGLRVAIEFQAGASFGNNLQTAAALIGEVGSPHLGLCLDAFHYYVGPSKSEDLQYLTAENLFHVQLCDIADQPRELASDADRILPGDGDIPLQPLLDHLRAIDYRGLVAVELMNPQIWQVPALQFGEIAMTALRKLLGQSSMSSS